MSKEFRIHFADEWTCYCGATFNNSDEYMLHLVEKKKKLMQSIGMDFEALNLLNVVKKLDDEQLDELIESLEDEAFNTKAFLLACQDEREERKKGGK